MLFHAHHFRTALLLFIGCMLASSLPAQGQVIPLKNWAAPPLYGQLPPAEREREVLRRFSPAIAVAARKT